MQELQELDRMFIEPDGSFVWVGDQQEVRWQLDGVLYDWSGRLQHVELQGNCFSTQLDRLLTCLGWPATSIMFQLPELSLYLAEPEFRRVSEVP